MQFHPYRWRLSGSFLAHLLKATTQQHHQALAPTITRLVPSSAVVFDVGAYAGQYTKLFARAASHGQVYAFEPGSYARSILRTVVWLRGLSNVVVLPIALGSEVGLNTLTIPLKQSGSFGFGLSHLGKPLAHWHAVAQEIVALATIEALAENSVLSLSEGGSHNGVSPLICIISRASVCQSGMPTTCGYARQMARSCINTFWALH